MSGCLFTLAHIEATVTLQADSPLSRHHFQGAILAYIIVFLEYIVKSIYSVLEKQWSLSLSLLKNSCPMTISLNFKLKQ